MTFKIIVLIIGPALIVLSGQIIRTLLRRPWTAGGDVALAILAFDVALWIERDRFVLLVAERYRDHLFDAIPLITIFSVVIFSVTVALGERAKRTALARAFTYEDEDDSVYPVTSWVIMTAWFSFHTAMFI